VTQRPHPFGTRDAGRPGPLAGRVVIVTGAGARPRPRLHPGNCAGRAPQSSPPTWTRPPWRRWSAAARDTPGSVARAGPATSPTLTPRACCCAPRYTATVNCTGPGVQRWLAAFPDRSSGLDDDDLRLLFDVPRHRGLPVATGHRRLLAGRSQGRAGPSTPPWSSPPPPPACTASAPKPPTGAAKAAAAMLARVGADELGRYGATVNAIAPVATEPVLTEWLGGNATGTRSTTP